MARLCWLAVFALCAGALALPAAPVPTHLMPKEETLFHSVRPGDTFVYVCNGGECKITIATADRTNEGYKVVQAGTHTNGTKYERVMLVSRTGVRMIRADNLDYAEPYPWLSLPPVTNNKWTTKQFGVTFYFKSADWEDLELPYGKVRALRTEYGLDEKYGAGVYYWAHGLGCVKWAEARNEGELKAFTPGK
jgi:hypothetical protein